MKPKGITFDFYLTLIRPRDGKARGGLYHEFLADRGLHADPWEHEVLYDIFAYYAAAYDPSVSDTAKAIFWVGFTRQLFKRTNVIGYDEDQLRVYAETIRDIFGPKHFELFPEVRETLRDLKQKGLKLAVLSNWQRGLRFFCQELGIDEFLSDALASAEVGFEKPDRRIFEEAIRRLQLAPDQLMHVGDSFEEDVVGARAAGFGVVLVDRDEKGCHEEVMRVSDLSQLIGIV